MIHFSQQSLGFLKNTYLFSILFFLAALGPSWRHTGSLLRHAGSFSLQCAVCSGFSLVAPCRFSLSSCGAQAPGCVGSVVVACGLQSAWALFFAAGRLSC